MSSVLVLGAGPLSRNPRVLKEATALGRAGFEVTVTSIASEEQFEEYDRSLVEGAPFRTVALDRMRRGPPGTLISFVERLGTFVARKAVGLGIQTPYVFGPYHALLRLAMRHPADLTIVHTELGFCVGRALMRHGRRVAVDFEDWHSKDLLPSARAHRPLRMLSRIEGQLLRESAYSSAPSGAMAAALASEYGGRVPIVVRNAFPLQPPSPPLPRNNPPAFFWFSQTIGPGRGLEAFLGAWAMTQRASKVALLGDVDEAYKKSLLDVVPESRRNMISFMRIVPPGSLPGVIAGFDIGLALENRSPESRDLTITNKIFQYMNAGLAVLATPTGGQSEVMKAAPGCGVLIDSGNTASLAAQIDGLLASPATITAMGSAARRAAEGVFNWDVSAAALVSAVRDALR